MDVPIIFIDNEGLQKSAGKINGIYDKQMSKIGYLESKGKETSDARDDLMSLRYLRSALEPNAHVEFLKIKFCFITPEFNFQCRFITNILDGLNIEYKSVIR